MPIPSSDHGGDPDEDSLPTPESLAEFLDAPLQEVRKELYENQETVARKAEVSPATLSRAERLGVPGVSKWSRVIDKVIGYLRTKRGGGLSHGGVVHQFVRMSFGLSPLVRTRADLFRIAVDAANLYKNHEPDEDTDLGGGSVQPKGPNGPETPAAVRSRVSRFHAETQLKRLLGL